MYMEVIFSELKQKDVINIADGKHLGKVCDLTFSFPEGRVAGFWVTGCKGFKLTKQELFLPIKSIVKIGEDAVLCKLEEEKPQPCPPPPDKNCPPLYPPPPPQSRRSLEEYE